MITILEHKNRRYLTGIFANKPQAIAHLQKIEEESNYSKDDFLLIETQLPFYPIYIIEGLEPTFIYTDKQSDIIDLLKRTNENRKDDNHHIYYNIYRISENDSTPYWGSDSMGMLEHYHINNSDLDHFQKTGFPDFFGAYDNLFHQLQHQIQQLTTQQKATPNNPIIQNQINEIQQALQTLRFFEKHHLAINEIEKVITLGMDRK